MEAAEPFIIGFSGGGLYVLVIFVLIHKLGWAEQMEEDKRRRDDERAN
jgi:hypothetical protein